MYVFYTVSFFRRNKKSNSFHFLFWGNFLSHASDNHKSYSRQKCLFWCKLCPIWRFGSKKSLNSLDCSVWIVNSVEHFVENISKNPNTYATIVTKLSECWFWHLKSNFLWPVYCIFQPISRVFMHNLHALRLTGWSDAFMDLFPYS